MKRGRQDPSSTGEARARLLPCGRVSPKSKQYRTHTMGVRCRQDREESRLVQPIEGR